jgi:ribonuclease HII
MVNSLLDQLIAFDKKVISKNKLAKRQILVIGVDEVGRGCLAGPVVAAAASIPKFMNSKKQLEEFSRLNDSKQLTHEIRQTLDGLLKQTAHYGIGEASPKEIDEINILQASLLAMKRAVADLAEKLNDTSELLLLIDGNKQIPNLNYKQITVVKGDALSASIAAASIIAKVHRDQIMVDLSKEHPEYNWHKNKGYGSKHHRQALETHGPSIWHRRSFNLNPAKQLSLFS